LKRALFFPRIFVDLAVVALVVLTAARLKDIALDKALYSLGDGVVYVLDLSGAPFLTCFQKPITGQRCGRKIPIRHKINDKGSLGPSDHAYRTSHI